MIQDETTATWSVRDAHTDESIQPMRIYDKYFKIQRHRLVLLVPH